MGHRHLLVHPETHLLQSSTGNQHVVLIGVAFSSDGRPVRQLLDDLDASSDDSLARTLEMLGGLYALIIHSDERTRIYTDPGGMHNIFYRDGVVSSSPALLPGVASDLVLRRQFRLDPHDSWMLGRHTPFAGVEVVPANHFLDLDRFVVERFWPVEPVRPLTEEESIERGAEVLRNAALSLGSDHRLLISLTGGRDSRLMLAAALSAGVRVRAFSIDVFSNRERAIVEELIRATGVEHIWLPKQTAPREIVDVYDEITLGMSLGSRREVAGSCWALRDTNEVHVSGNLGAICKAFYWARSVPEKMTADLVLKDFRQQAPVIRDGFYQWLETVPEFLPNQVRCNLLYMEQRGGRWMGIGENAANVFYLPTTLFCSRALFLVSVSAPADLQRQGQLLDLWTAACAPGLDAILYNSGTSRWRRSIPGWIKRPVSRIEHKVQNFLRG